MLRMQQALARSRAYTLLADLAARGLTPPALAPLRAVAQLAPLLPAALDAQALEQCAVEHQTVFGLNLFACAGVFLEAESRMGGQPALRAAATYAALGFAAPPGAEADSLQSQLACLAFLCGAEADALEDHQPAAADRARKLQADFLRGHLLPWLPALCEALARQPSAFYAALAPLLATLCFDHYGDLVSVVDGAAPAAAADPAAESSPESAAAPPLELSEASLRAIARRLLTPVHSGLFLARSDLVQLARRCDLPTGFGERLQMLSDLFRAAGHFEKLPALLNGIDQLLAQAEAHHVALEEEAPAAAAFLAPWLARLDGSRALVASLRAAAQ